MNKSRRKRIADLVEKLSGIMIELDEAVETANDIASRDGRRRGRRASVLEELAAAEVSP